MADTDHGHVPDSLYQRDDRGDRALARLLRTGALVLLAAILWWLFATDDGDLSWVHVLAGVAAIPLAYAATPLKEQDR